MIITQIVISCFLFKNSNYFLIIFNKKIYKSWKKFLC